MNEQYFLKCVFKLQTVEMSADAAIAKGKDSLGRITCVLCRWRTNCAVSIHESCTSTFKLFPVYTSILTPSLLKAQVRP